MKPSICLAAVAATQTSVFEIGKKIMFGSAPMPDIDTHNRARVIPSKDISLHYASNSSSAANATINVKHTMKYPTILLEEIASVINVDCSANSVAMKFNDASVFATSRSNWSANSTFVLITNHLGDCDEELERSFFVVKSLSWDSKKMVCTAKSEKSDIESTAGYTEITFGGLPANALRERALVLDPSYTLSSTVGLPQDTTLYSYEPYLNVVADTASFAASVTLSGYLKYNWWGFKLESLYFDLDASFDAKLALTASIESAYNTTFTYAPDALQYGVTVPGLLEFGPQLIFSVDALVAASESVNITTAVGVGLSDGNVHLDLLDSGKTSTSGWNPVYQASADISGQAKAQIDPTASLTVELEIRALGGLVDLSSGITARPGFHNTFTLTATEGITLEGNTNTTVDGTTCQDGLSINSDFTFALDAFVTQWWSGELYSVKVPIVDKCYSWEN